MDPRIEAWMSRGRHLQVGGRAIFVWEQGEGRPLVMIHGFPASSYDWRAVANLVSGRRLVAFDLPGFGLSDKSADGNYSLFAHADVFEGVLGALGISSCDVLAHDLGDTVAAELLARSNSGEISVDLGHVVLLNGSIFIDLAQLTSGQRLFLRLPPRRLPVPPPLRLFRRQIRALFSPEHDPGDEEIEMMEALLAHEGGHRLVPVTIRYIEERRANAARWTSALVDHPGPLSALWGLRDSVAVPAMVDRLEALRPDTAVVRWPDVGHWPQIEVPERVAAEIAKLPS